MFRNIQAIIKKENFWIIFSIILLIPAFFPNLGIITFIEDESIRALVSLEMKLSGNYITSTIGGDLYLKKPPLYNWIIAASFTIFGKASEMASRVPTIIALFLYGATVFYYVKKFFNRKLAILTALCVITSGRILIYESLKGLIDISFSWVIFTMFMIVIDNILKEKYLKLFIFSYLLAFLGYMLKGLPSFVFLGLTLSSVFIYQKKWKKLFSIHHFIAGGVALFLFIGFYLVYFHYSSVPIEKVFSTLLGETTRRTFLRFGILLLLKHLITFPFEVIFHFMPYTLMLVFLFNKDVRKKIKGNNILGLFIVVFLVNIIVYWTSEEVFARYLLMFIPLIYSVLIYAFLETEDYRLKSIFEIVMFGAIFLVFLAFLVVPWFVKVPGVEYYILKWGLISLVFAGLLIAWFFLKDLRLFIFIASLLIIRVGFNFFVLPYRANGKQNLEYNKVADKIAMQTSGCKVFTFWPDSIKPDEYYGKRIMDYQMMFYLTNNKQQILKSVNKMDEGQYYLAIPDHISGVQYELMDSFNVDSYRFWLIKKK
jgi:4-amino-4-deoxy-L-arabinose transferase-like glycosyltransferase